MKFVILYEFYPISQSIHTLAAGQGEQNMSSRLARYLRQPSLQCAKHIYRSILDLQSQGTYELSSIGLFLCYASFFPSDESLFHLSSFFFITHALSLSFAIRLMTLSEFKSTASPNEKMSSGCSLRFIFCRCTNMRSVP